MYKYNTTIKLHETDAAGLLFFSNQLRMMHDAYETMLNETGLGLGTVLKEKGYVIVIVHAEADYAKPLFVGDRITIEVSLERAGDKSFTLFCRLVTKKGEVAGTGKTVHVSVDKSTNQAVPLPSELRDALQKI